MADRSADELPEHARRNREVWDSELSAGFAARARKQWAADPHWGIWAVPQTDLPLLPSDLAGKDVVELGCGTAYVSSWIARSGGQPVGIDNSERQLAAARAMQNEFNVHFPLLHGNAEQVPYPDSSFDLAISEHGAAAWCDPYRWIPEAARLLRPGGELVFLRSSELLVLCMPDEGRADRVLRRPQFGLSRIEHSNGAVTFHLPHGPMIQLLRQCGFVVEDLQEVRPAQNAPTEFDYVDLDWARQWPSEEVWKARRIDAG
ncbi:class I SAM-dependent methyltransferase [Actinopolymorpha sp. B17G11]|uniref:class I SAM-dependent methyltransferase n=1 Tax=Actinopolymorpha sp. B17G11 TaxID=3160861 RepID=UPI0032E46C4F